ncbi:MAG: hypothetical protein R3D97_12440 [Paracoccaceae bacterium]
MTPTGGSAQVFSYDANGNMLTGLDGKVMSYDGENRPLSVANAGKTTTYVYGADRIGPHNGSGLITTTARTWASAASHSPLN